MTIAVDINMSFDDFLNNISLEITNLSFTGTASFYPERFSPHFILKRSISWDVCYSYVDKKTQRPTSLQRFLPNNLKRLSEKSEKRTDPVALLAQSCEDVLSQVSDTLALCIRTPSELKITAIPQKGFLFTQEVPSPSHKDKTIQKSFMTPTFAQGVEECLKNAIIHETFTIEGLMAVHHKIQKEVIDVFVGMPTVDNDLCRGLLKHKMLENNTQDNDQTPKRKM